MILSHERKAGVFFVPRTGTNTLRVMFENTGIPLEICSDDHFGYANLAELGYTNLDGYKFYAIYRDPFERCMSIMNYLRRGRQHAKFFHAVYGHTYQISCADRSTYNDWDDGLKAVCDSVPMIEVFRKLKWFMERGVFGKTHKRWLEGPVIPLNYDTYDASVTEILTAFGVDPATVTIPHINPSITLPEFDTLSPDEEAEIRDYLQEDYDFLASKGVTFP